MRDPGPIDPWGLPFDEPPAVSGNFWKGIAWAAVLSLPLWILAVVGILAIFAAKS